MNTIKTVNYANHTPELSVHIYGFSSFEACNELSEEINKAIHKFCRNHKEEALEHKITLD